MAKSGYTIVDLSGYNFVGETPQVIPGLYAKLSQTNDAILVTGLTIGGETLRNSYTYTQADTDKVRCSILVVSDTTLHSTTIEVMVHDNVVVYDKNFTMTEA